ncbi:MULTISPECIES: methylated-DNA--[protein]-cysteine S-methyltransferase [Lactobacillales]|uniref:methylated-DNA--[protein]-cysteine S-methyltransferase n=1 Tax=Lactobacillales TaxID=186826 RepID=UPI000660F360|nr:methylated-DNA--[protein]-cysteine S-methyltransferase [Carnobacterium sp. 1290_CSPC]
MYYKSSYTSPLGQMTIVNDEHAIKGLWFSDQRYFGGKYDLQTMIEGETPVTKQVKNWLDAYFAGENPTLDPNILAPEVTSYRKQILNALINLPYGQTTSYKELADKVALNTLGKRGSARAAGGAVGHNPISILIPCHRVVATNGALTGYAGGIDRKIALLALEGFDQSKLDNHQV